MKHFLKKASMNAFKQTILFAITIILVLSCQVENTQNTKLGLNDTEGIINTTVRKGSEILHELSYAIPNAGLDVPFNFAKTIQTKGDIYETLYPSDIFSPKTKASSPLLSEILDKSEKYPFLRDYLFSTKTDNHGFSDLPVEFYFPNSESFDSDKEEFITIAYPSKESEDWTDGYIYDRAGNKTYVPYIDESYFEKNMTIVILPADTTNYTKPLSEKEIQQFITKRANLPTKSGLSNGLITTNIVNSANISEEDILVTSIAAIRVDGTSWCGTISNKLKLAVYRASGDIEFNTDGSLKPSGTCHKPFIIPIPKKQLKDRSWIKGNYIFDDDWDLHEYDQKIYFVSEHNMGATSADLTATVGIGYKDKKPSVELSAKADVKVSFSTHSKLRQHNQFTRASMLANITNNLGNGLYNGHTIFSYGIVDMVFNYYYTDVK